MDLKKSSKTLSKDVPIYMLASTDKSTKEICPKYGGLVMNKNKKALYDLMENYFYDCKQNGYSDFGVWCEDNIDNDEQESLLFEIKEHVNAIADILF